MYNLQQHVTRYTTTMSFMQRSEVDFQCAHLDRKWLEARNEHRRCDSCPIDPSRVELLESFQYPGCPQTRPLTALLNSLR